MAPSTLLLTTLLVPAIVVSRLLLPEGLQPHWRGRITAAAFDYEVQGS